jgi:hypothetical protein
MPESKSRSQISTDWNSKRPNNRPIAPCGSVRVDGTLAIDTAFSARTVSQTRAVSSLRNRQSKDKSAIGLTDRSNKRFVYCYVGEFSVSKQLGFIGGKPATSERQ